MPAQQLKFPPKVFARRRAEFQSHLGCMVGNRMVRLSYLCKEVYNPAAVARTFAARVDDAIGQAR